MGEFVEEIYQLSGGFNSVAANLLATNTPSVFFNFKLKNNENHCKITLSC